MEPIIHTSASTSISPSVITSRSTLVSKPRMSTPRTVSRYSLRLLRNLQGTQEMYVAYGELEKALPVARQALCFAEKLYGPNATQLVLHLSDLAQVLHMLERDEEASPFLERATLLIEQQHACLDQHHVCPCNQLDTDALHKCNWSHSKIETRSVAAPKEVTYQTSKPTEAHQPTTPVPPRMIATSDAYLRIN